MAPRIGKMPAKPHRGALYSQEQSSRTRVLPPAWHPSAVAIWTLFILFGLIWFFVLHARTLVPTDEGRYAEMAREMAASGDFITTRLNGIKYFEKPPLQLWITALVFKVFGLGEWQARLWTGLCGFAGILMTAFAGSRLFNARVGFTAGMVLASCFYWAAMGHASSLDMGFAGMINVALCAFFLAQRDDATRRGQRNWMLVCWAAMALAVLSKGLIGIVLPGGALALYALLTRDRAIWKRVHAGQGLALFTVIIAPWFILVSITNPEFPRFFFIHEHLERFISKVHRREGAWYYFIPYLSLGIMPWLPLLPQSLYKGWGAATKGTIGGFQPTKMLLAWSAFIFVFFSASGSKLPSYILPIFPALALLIAHHLEEAAHEKSIRITAGLFAACSAAGLALVWKMPSLAKNAYELPLYQAYMPWAAGAAVIGLTSSAFAVWMARRHKYAALLAIAMGSFLTSQALMLGFEPLGRYKAGTIHIPAIRAELTPETPIYAVGKYEHVLPFYLQRTLILVGNPDEMAFGLRQEPHLWLPTLDAFVVRWDALHAQGRKAIAILHPDVFTKLEKSAVPMRVIARDPHRVIVTNDPSE